MTIEPETLKSLVKAAAEQVIASAPELTALDQAIGDGDHGVNMKRGFEAVLGKLDMIGAQPLDEAFKTIGKTLVMTIGGASGPLYGSFFMAAGEALSQHRQLPEDIAEVFGRGVGAVSARGRSQPGEKTMLDVLCPVLETLKAEAGRPDLIQRVRTTASEVGGANGADAGDERAGGVPRRAQRRACRSRRAVELHAVCTPFATAWRRGNERHRRYRHRVALAGHRQRHRRHGAPDGRQRGQGGVLRGQSRRRSWHQRVFDHRCHQQRLVAERGCDPRRPRRR